MGRMWLFVIAMVVAALATACVPEKVQWSPGGTRGAIMAPDGLHVFDGDGKLVGKVEGEAVDFKWIDGQVIAEIREGGGSMWVDPSELVVMSFSRDGKTAFAARCSDGKGVALLRVAIRDASGALLQNPGKQTELAQASFGLALLGQVVEMADGTLLYAAQLAELEENYAVYLLRPDEKPRELVRIPALLPVFSASPDGKWIAMSGQDGTAAAFRVADGKRVDLCGPQDPAPWLIPAWKTNTTVTVAQADGKSAMLVDVEVETGKRTTLSKDWPLEICRSLLVKPWTLTPDSSPSHR